MCIPILPVLRKIMTWSLAYSKFQASLGYIVRPFSKKQNKTKNNKGRKEAGWEGREGERKRKM
jgi:hypothetical protein